MHVDARALAAPTLLLRFPGVPGEALLHDRDRSNDALSSLRYRN